MNDIISIENIAKDIYRLYIKNKAVADKFKPGQFVIVRAKENSERIPLTIAGAEEGRLQLVVQEVGYSTEELCSLKKGDKIKDLAGPLGEATDIKKHGKIFCLAGGIGAAPLLPVAKALKKAGNKIIISEGVRNKEYLIFENELKEIADSFILMSDDGSAGKQGLVTKPLIDRLESGESFDHVYAVGPPIMMRAVSIITKKYNLPLTVSLNPIMVDGTGMCGSCRVEVGDETKFACVDGPEFDGNKVNFDNLINRLNMYGNEEKEIKDHKRCC